MDGFIAAIVGFFLSIGAFFQGGQLAPTQPVNETTKQASISANAPYEVALKEGEEPFFGKVIDVKDTTLVVQTPVKTNGKNTLIVKIDKSTSYLDGKQSDIIKDTNIAGIGKLNKDGSINASKIQIKMNK
jgi:hypothetical protein